MTVGGEPCVLFEGTPWVAQGTVDVDRIHKKHETLLDKIHEATDTFDFKAVYYRGYVRAMGKEVDKDKARKKLIERLCQYLGFRKPLIIDLFRASKIHSLSWEVKGKDGLTRTERTIHEFLDTRPIFHRNEIEPFITYHYTLRYNIVKGKPERLTSNDYVELDDYMFNSIRRKIINLRGKISTQDLRQLLVSDFIDRYDPFKAYFSSLPA